MIVRDDSYMLTLGRRFARLAAAAATSAAPSIGERRRHLRQVEALVRRHAADFARAIAADFGQRSHHETSLSEVFPVLAAARHARQHVARWAAPQRKGIAPYFAPARARIEWQPLGVVGIIAPWNYPVLLALQPLVAALAAGNRALIKMSESTPQTADLLARVVETEFAEDHVRVVTGGVEIARAFAALPFDHLLFTGSATAGRSVMRSAAHNLVPVTLELGGKSPVIVGPDAPLASAAARIMAGKLRNAGQTCIAPDYALVPRAAADAFVAHARDAAVKLYPGAGGPGDYAGIIDAARHARLRELLADAVGRGATVVPLHQHGAAFTQRMLPPAIVRDVDDSMQIMHEEIFGPLLPLLTYTNLDEAIAYVNARPAPLALYFFGSNQRDIDAVIGRTRSGGVCVNDVVLQFAQNDLPFGGRGASGFGAYHGRDGFERLSHKRAVFVQARHSAARLLEPPYRKRFEVLLSLLLR